MNSKYLLILIKTFCIIDTSISTKRVLKILTCGYWVYLLCRHNDWEPNNLQYREKKSFDNVLKMNGLKLGHKVSPWKHYRNMVIIATPITLSFSSLNNKQLLLMESASLYLTWSDSDIFVVSWNIVSPTDFTNRFRPPPLSAAVSLALGN